MTSTTPTIRAYSYLRFSTPEQSKGDSLRRQVALADEYAQRHGLTLDTELNLRDLGVSAFRGTNAALGALGAFRRAVTDGLVEPGSYLLVESLDRVSRQEARKAVRTLEEIVEAGVIVVTLNDGKRYTEESLDGTDFLMAILLFMRSHEESATKAKRLKAAWSDKRTRAARGEILSVRVPAWIHGEGSAAKDVRSAKLSLIPERAALVRRMFDLYIAGVGKAQIAATFNGEKIPTWSAGKGHRAGVYWHSSYVFKILTSPTVTGRFTPYIESYLGGKFSRAPQAPIPDYYPRVIDDETFERAQWLSQARRKTTRRAGIASIVAGLTRCPACGSAMARINKGKRAGAGIHKLVCRRAKAGAGCTYVSVRLPVVEQALIRSATDLRNPPGADMDLSTQIDAANLELFHLNEQIETLVDAIEQAPSAALSKRLAARETEVDRVRAEFAQLKARAADSESRVVKHRAKRLADALIEEPCSVAAANAALRECVNSVVVDYRTGELRLQWRHGVESSVRYVWPEFPVEELESAEDHS